MRHRCVCEVLIQNVNTRPTEQQTSVDSIQGSGIGRLCLVSSGFPDSHKSSHYLFCVSTWVTHRHFKAPKLNSPSFPAPQICCCFSIFCPGENHQNPLKLSDPKSLSPLIPYFKSTGPVNLCPNISRLPSLPTNKALSDLRPTGSHTHSPHMTPQQHGSPGPSSHSLIWMALLPCVWVTPTDPLGKVPWTKPPSWPPSRPPCHPMHSAIALTVMFGPTFSSVDIISCSSQWSHYLAHRRCPICLLKS